MLIYEVNLVVFRDVSEAYEVWLRKHVDELLGLPGFIEARWYSRDPEEGEGDQEARWTIHYVMKDRESFVRYLREDAARMREDGLKRFGGKFQASRRVLSQVSLRHARDVEGV